MSDMLSRQSLVPLSLPPRPNVLTVTFTATAEKSILCSFRLPPAPAPEEVVTAEHSGQGTLERRSLLVCETPALIDRFVQVRNNLPEGLQPFLTPYSVDQYLERGARLYLTPDERGGFGVANGELISLFSYPRAGYGNILVSLARECGASRLCCYDTDGRLVRLYHRHGFREVNRQPWNPRYAPYNWPTGLLGKPDYVEMEVER